MEPTYSDDGLIVADEDNDFLNQVDMGYVGLSKPQVKKWRDPYLDLPRWQQIELNKASKLSGLSVDEVIDQYGYPDSWDIKDGVDYGNEPRH